MRMGERISNLDCCSSFTDLSRPVIEVFVLHAFCHNEDVWVNDLVVTGSFMVVTALIAVVVVHFPCQ